MTGTLYIVATPIGNLKDITLRAIEILRDVDYILCEDTRVTGNLLHHYQIQKKMLAFNEFNENVKYQSMIVDLNEGKSVALVSDGGTPLISDPGFKLVRESAKSGIRVESVPGSSAVISALTASGLPTDKFLFLGFLPKKDGPRLKLLKDVASTLRLIKVTVVIYESPYRIVKTLESIRDVFGEIDVAVCRELTKLHEEVRHEKVSEAISHFQKVPAKGELTIVF